MEDIILEESLDFVDAIDFANNLHPYEEGLGDVVHKVGTGIKNFFGTKAGAAQRAQADAQQNLQTAQANQQASQINAQANAISAPDAAQNIINLLQKAFGKQIMPASYEPITIFILAPGAFFVLAGLVAIQNKVKLSAAKRGKKVEAKAGCGEGCGNCTNCGGGK